MNLRLKAESLAASAEEKATSLEGKLGHLSESIEREKKRLHDEHSQLKRDSKLSISRITANVSGYICCSVFRLMAIHRHELLFKLCKFSCCSLNKWNAKLIMLREKQSC